MNKKKIEAAKVYWHDAVEEVFAHPEKSLREVGLELHLSYRSLYSYILNNYRERWNKFCDEERPNLRGRKTNREESYKQVVAYIKEHPEEVLESVACKFGFHNRTSMAKYLRYNYPDLMSWRKEWKAWNKTQMDVKKRLAKRAAMEEAKRKKEREREQKRERELEREQKRERELEQKRDLELERERKRELEREQKRELEREQKRERERERELEREQKRERELERERERERKRELEREQKRERELERERAKSDYEKRRAWHFKELDAPVVPFAERIEAMQKRLNDIKNGLGDNFEPGDLPLLKVTPGGYSVKEWQKKQHTLDIIKRRMEEVKRIRGRA